MDRKEALKLFSTHLKKLRREKYKSLELFSKDINIPKSKLFHYEAGHNFPPINLLTKLSEGLKIPIEYLLLPLLNLKEEDKKLLQIIKTIKQLYKNPSTKKDLISHIDLLELKLDKELSSEKKRGRTTSG